MLCGWRIFSCVLRRRQYQALLGHVQTTRFTRGFDLVIERRIHIVNIFLAYPVLGQTQALTETLEVHDLPLPQEPNGVVDIGIVTKAKDVVIGDAGLLLCCDLVRTTFREKGLKFAIRAGIIGHPDD